MPLKSGVYSTIHAAASADTTNFYYHQVYAGAATTAVINGVTVTMAAGSTIDIGVRSISGTDVYVIGGPINVVNGPQTLSNYPNP
jgi:hypothetical protein